MWTGCDIDSVKEIWAEELSGYRIDEIASGVKACRSRDWPPTLPEFLKLCRPLSQAFTAYTEAVEQMRLREIGEDAWSHPAVYWAACEIGDFDLRNSTWDTIKIRWTETLQKWIAKGDLPAVPKRVIALPAPGQCSVPAEEALRRVALMANSLAKSKTLLRKKSKDEYQPVPMQPESDLQSVPADPEFVHATEKVAA